MVLLRDQNITISYTKKLQKINRNVDGTEVGIVSKRSPYYSIEETVNKGRRWKRLENKKETLSIQQIQMSRDFDTVQVYLFICRIETTKHTVMHK